MLMNRFFIINSLVSQNLEGDRIEDYTEKEICIKVDSIEFFQPYKFDGTLWVGLSSGKQFIVKGEYEVFKDWIDNPNTWSPVK